MRLVYLTAAFPCPLALTWPLTSSHTLLFCWMMPLLPPAMCTPRRTLALRYDLVSKWHLMSKFSVRFVEVVKLKTCFWNYTWKYITQHCCPATGLPCHYTVQPPLRENIFSLTLKLQKRINKNVALVLWASSLQVERTLSWVQHHMARHTLTQTHYTADAHWSW